MRYISSAIGAAALLSVAVGNAHAAQFLNIVDPLNPAFTQALGINGAGTVVGYGNASAFNGFQLTLPPVPGNFTRENFPPSLPTQVTGIDAAGDTVGFYVTNTTVGTTSGFSKASGGSFLVVNQPGSVFNQLLGINQAGNEIAGYSSFTDPAGMTGQQAFSLKGTTYTNINALLPTNLNSQATGVNNAGTVVGFYQYNSTPDFSAFVDKAGVVTSFQFPGSIDTQALGINDLGEIVGDYVAAGGQMFGFLDNGGIFSTINPPGATASTANGINDNGTTVGFYTAANGSTIGFLTPAPEPGTLFVLGSGLIGLTMALRRRRSAG
jgi:hypothetical protein